MPRPSRFLHAPVLGTPVLGTPFLGTLSLAALLTVAVALTGCSNTETQKSVEKDHLELIRANKVYLERPGRGITDKHVGFIEEKVRVSEGEDLPGRVYMAFDSNYRVQLGYYLQNGATFKINARGEHESLGSYDLQRTLKELYGHDGSYRLAPL